VGDFRCIEARSHRVHSSHLRLRATGRVAEPAAARPGGKLPYTYWLYLSVGMLRFRAGGPPKDPTSAQHLG
jgi:hypothetical protein